MSSYNVYALTDLEGCSQMHSNTVKLEVICDTNNEVEGFQVLQVVVWNTTSFTVESPSY